MTELLRKVRELAAPGKTSRRPIDQYYNKEISLDEYIKTIASKPVPRSKRIKRSERRVKRIAERHNLRA